MTNNLDDAERAAQRIAQIAREIPFLPSDTDNAPPLDTLAALIEVAKAIVNETPIERFLIWLVGKARR